MDRGAVKAVAFALATLFLPAGLAAHPHARADQQAHLSLGRSQATVTYYLNPSSRDGSHIFNHIDSDGDSRLSHAEMSMFARTLLARSRLSVDGRAVRLSVTHFAFPGQQAMSKGRGTIRVRAQARLNLTPGARHRLMFNVMDSRFGKNWFVQPFYFSGFMAGRTPPVVERSPGSNRVVISL